MSNKCDPPNLFLGWYNYNVWFENEESTDIITKRDLPPMPADEEVKKAIGLKILLPNKLLSRLPSTK